MVLQKLSKKIHNLIQKAQHNHVKIENNKWKILNNINFVIIFLQIYKIILEILEEKTNFLIVDILILVIGCYLVKNNISIAVKNINFDKNITELKLYNLRLKQANDDVRAFRHDFNNIMQAFGGYIKFNDLNGLKKYYNDLTEECNIVKNIAAFGPNILNEKNLYSSILKEVELAKEKGIEISFISLLELNKLRCENIYVLLKSILINSIKIAEISKKKEILITSFYDEIKRKNIILIINVFLEEEKEIIEKFMKNMLYLKEIAEVFNKNEQVEFCKSFDNCVLVQELRITQTQEVMS